MDPAPVLNGPVAATPLRLRPFVSRILWMLVGALVSLAVDGAVTWTQSPAPPPPALSDEARTLIESLHAGEGWGKYPDGVLANDAYGLRVVPASTHWWTAVEADGPKEARRPVGQWTPEEKYLIGEAAASLRQRIDDKKRADEERWLAGKLDKLRGLPTAAAAAAAPAKP